MEFAEKVRQLLKAQRLSQAELAEAVGTNQPQISRWLEANAPPKAAYLLKIARALGVSADYLIDPAQGPQPASDEPNEDERMVLELYRALGLDVHEALRRLATGPAPAGAPASGPAKIVAVRDETEAQVRRDRERTQKDRDQRKGSRIGPEGDDVGTKGPRSPRGVH